MQFLYFLIPCPEAHKSFHLDFEFLQLFGYFSFLVVSFFDTFESIFYSANFDDLYLTPNLSCYFGFRANFELGFSESGKKLLEPRIIKIEYLEAHMSFHLEFFSSTLELMIFQQGFFLPLKMLVCSIILQGLYLLDPFFKNVCI
jgi:hypothetical protein